MCGVLLSAAITTLVTNTASALSARQCTTKMHLLPAQASQMQSDVGQLSDYWLSHPCWLRHRVHWLCRCVGTGCAAHLGTPRCYNTVPCSCPEVAIQQV